MPTFRKRVNDTLQIKLQKHHNSFSLLVNVFLSALIFLNTIAIILHSIPKLRHTYEQIFTDFEVFSVVVFAIEYILRVWSVVEQHDYKHPLKGRIKYMFSAWGIIDFLAIFPFFISLFTTDLSFLRILRLLRIIRLFRLSKYFHALRVILNVLIAKKEELLLSMSFIFFLLFISSSTMYYIEHELQPQVFSSIPVSLWWGVNNMTTVGYGDMMPITAVGKIISGLVSILGVASFALPTGILASGFAEHLDSQKGIKCPHCGEKI